MKITTERVRKSLPSAILVLVSLALPLVFNPYIFYGDQWLSFSLLAYVASAALTLFLLALACRIRTVGFIILPIIFLCAIGGWYIYRLTGMFISESVVASILETDRNEAGGFISWKNITFTLVAAAALVAGVLSGHKKISSKASNTILAVSLGVFGVFAGAAYPVGKMWQQDGLFSVDRRMAVHGMLWPVYDVRTVYRNVRDYYRSDPKRMNGIMELPSGYEPRAEGEAPAEQDIIVVMMIGESVRAGNLQINGYARETTPCLAQWVLKDQLVSFPKTCSFGVLTRISLIGLTTDAEIGNRTPQHRPYYDILAKDGVWTASLLPQTVSKHLVRMTGDILHTYKFGPDLATRNNSHGATVDAFEQAVAESAAEPRVFMLLYDTGAHGPYDSVAGNKKFLPDDDEPGPGADVQEVVNGYDNAIREVDAELSAMMDILESTGRPAVFLYASDHGEALGEDGRFFHGFVAEQTYTPAIMVWVSSAYKAKYPERYAIIKSHAGKAVSHDHIMHTVLSLCGIHRGAYKRELDLTSPQIRETPVPDDPSKLENFRLPSEQGGTP